MSAITLHSRQKAGACILISEAHTFYLSLSFVTFRMIESICNVCVAEERRSGEALISFKIIAMSAGALLCLAI